MFHSFRKLFLTTFAMSALCCSMSALSQLPPGIFNLVQRPFAVYENQNFEIEFFDTDQFSPLTPESSYLVDETNIAVFHQSAQASLAIISPRPPTYWHILVQEISGLPAGEYSVYTVAVPFGEEAPVEFDFSNTVLSPRGTVTVLPGGFDLNVGLGSPRAGEVVGGFGVIRGWACYSRETNTIPAIIGKISYQIDNMGIKTVPYGSSRGDTTERCDGISSTGFAAPINWNRFPLGEHTFTLYVDGQEVISHDVVVSGTGETYLRGLEAEYKLNNFPSDGDTTTVKWSQSAQDFTIIDVDRN